MTLSLRCLRTTDADFDDAFKRVLHWSEETDTAIEQRVAAIVADVRTRGDAAVLEYTQRFDDLSVSRVADLELDAKTLRAALDAISPAQRHALEEAAARVLALAPTTQKNQALAAMAQAIRADRAAILAANAEDMAEGRASGLTSASLDRLELNDKRIEGMAEAVEIVRDLADPVGKVTESWTRPNGMTIARVRVPIGVIGIIFESRPNVTADAGALALKAGNAVILRGGSDSYRSSRAIHADRKSTRLNSSHVSESRMPSSA